MIQRSPSYQFAQTSSPPALQPDLPLLPLEDALPAAAATLATPTADCDMAAA
jgi:hypothetical protein